MTTERPPTEAYHEMVEILGDEFFLTQPPSMGVDVTVQGRDGHFATWALTDAQAIWIKPYIHNNPHLRFVSAVPYDLSVSS